MRRIVVVGTSGSGKSTLARQIARVKNIPYIELDALFHGPNWTPRADFVQNVEAAISGEAWVIDGNYGVVRLKIWAAADVIIWLDYSMTITFTRVFRRTVGRWWRRDVLWNGNRETLWLQFCTRDSLFLWVLTTWRRHRRDYPGRLREQVAAGKKVVRLHSPKDAQRWLQALSAAESSHSGMVGTI
jgi:adenylate kinase family enzyme